MPSSWIVVILGSKMFSLMCLWLYRVTRIPQIGWSYSSCPPMSLLRSRKIKTWHRSKQLCFLFGPGYIGDTRLTMLHLSPRNHGNMCVEYRASTLMACQLKITAEIPVKPWQIKRIHRLVAFYAKIGGDSAQAGLLYDIYVSPQSQMLHFCIWASS